MIGTREDSYNLVAFTDASTKMYGVVVYALNTNTNELSYILAKNRIINNQLEHKTAPTLELQAIALGCETLIEVFKGLAGNDCTVPIKIEKLFIYSDSLVALSWVNENTNKFDKMNKRSVFVMNRIKQIGKSCDIHPIHFNFISGCNNPADMVTRCISSKILKKSNYITGPNSILKQESSLDPILSFRVPNPNVRNEKLQTHTNFSIGCNETNFKPDYDTCANFAQTSDYLEPLIDPSKFSSFSKLIRVHAYVLRFINKLRIKAKQIRVKKSLPELIETSTIQIIKTLQHFNFADIYDYLESPQKTLKNIPNLVNKLNIYMDASGLLRVKSKFGRWQLDKPYNFPLLLPKNSPVTEIIILDLHKRFNHLGCYAILSELRKRFWLPHCFSVVKKTP